MQEAEPAGSAFFCSSESPHSALRSALAYRLKVIEGMSRAWGRKATADVSTALRFAQHDKPILVCGTREVVLFPKTRSGV